MHFAFALELSDIDLWNTDLLDTHLDLLSPDKHTDIPSKYFVCLHKIFKTSSRHVFKASSRHVFNTSSRHVFKTCLQDVFKTNKCLLSFLLHSCSLKEQLILLDQGSISDRNSTALNYFILPLIKINKSIWMICAIFLECAWKDCW